MKLLDSNILIYSFYEEFIYLRELIWSDDVFISEITRLEVAGFHGLSVSEEAYFHDIFLVVKSQGVDSRVFDEAIRLRKTYKMKLGDSIIAATAVVYGLDLFTRNMADFIKIPELKVVNPITV